MNQPLTTTLLFSAHRLKSKRGMETLPSCSGAFLCLLESGDPPAFWFSTPNKVRLSMDSSGSTATAMGKLMLGQRRTESVHSEDTTNRTFWLLLYRRLKKKKVKTRSVKINYYFEQLQERGEEKEGK